MKQACTLAPTLFNLFINDLNTHLKEINAYGPKMGSNHIPLLLYADNMILQSTSRVGLRRLITYCIDYLKKNELHLNFDKSKVVVFGKSWKLLNWSFKGKVIEQVKEFKYLGIYFHHKHSWTTHRKMAVNLAKVTTQVIIRFHLTRGNSYVPAALLAFNAKTISQFL